MIARLFFDRMFALRGDFERRFSEFCNFTTRKNA